MRNVSAVALGLLLVGAGIYAASAVTPLAFPAAFTSAGATSNALALFVMLSITEVTMMFAAWVVARLVTDHQAGHAMLLATFALAIAVFVGAIRWASAPVWYHWTSWVLMPVFAMLGARAWENSQRRREQSASRRMATT